MKIELGPDDRDKVWKIADSWVHYAWADGQWYCYPGDPRRLSPGVIRHRASRQEAGAIRRMNGLVEVP